MRKGVLKVTACCMAGLITVSGNGVLALADGLETPLAGFSQELTEQQQKKSEAGVVSVEPSEYDTLAIAQVDEYVNIRDSASTEGNIVGKLYNNCAAEILGESDGW